MSGALKWLTTRRVLIVRHGNTGKADTDAQRQITAQGEKQCEAFRARYQEQLDNVKIALCSPVDRTVTTAKLIGFPEAVKVPDLYFGNFYTDELRAADRDIGYAPVKEYLTKYGHLYAEPIARMTAALAAVGKEVNSYGDVLIVAHATYLSLIALEVQKAHEMGSAASPKARELIMNTNVGEVCGFSISRDGIEYLSNNSPSENKRARCNDDHITGISQGRTIPPLEEQEVVVPPTSGPPENQVDPRPPADTIQDRDRRANLKRRGLRKSVVMDWYTWDQFNVRRGEREETWDEYMTHLLQLDMQR